MLILPTRLTPKFYRIYISRILLLLNLKYFFFIFCRQPRKKIMSTILDNIGNTPLVRLNSIPKSYGLKCEIRKWFIWNYSRQYCNVRFIFQLQSANFLTLAVALKIALACVWLKTPRKQGKSNLEIVWLNQHQEILVSIFFLRSWRIIKCISFSAGIGIALAAAVKGYRCIIVLPEKMSNEKVDTLKALGAEIVRTPTSASFDSPESHISVAQRLNRDIPNSMILDQVHIHWNANIYSFNFICPL